MRTCALVSISGTIAQLCLPHFDSPSVFARILDKDKGGHFSIRTANATTSKQQYLPSTSALVPAFLWRDVTTDSRSLSSDSCPLNACLRTLFSLRHPRDQVPL